MGLHERTAPVTRMMTAVTLRTGIAILVMTGLSPVYAAGLQAPAPAPRSIQALPPTPTTGSADEKLRAAAEPFEKLTETAFTGSRTALATTLAEALVTAQSVHALLPEQSVKRFGDEIDALKAASQNHRRAAIALSSIEVYRTLVIAVADGAKVPAGLSLLDCAGYRYQADLKSSPRQWSDMADAADFARQTWTALTPKVSSPALEAKVAGTISAMEQAACRKNASAAAKAAQTELDLVDDLEKLFASR